MTCGFFLASDRTVVGLQWCSVQPVVVVMKAFCIFWLRYTHCVILVVMYASQRFLMHNYSEELTHAHSR